MRLGDHDTLAWNGLVYNRMLMYSLGHFSQVGSGISSSHSARTKSNPSVAKNRASDPKPKRQQDFPGLPKGTANGVWRSLGSQSEKSTPHSRTYDAYHKGSGAIASGETIPSDIRHDMESKFGEHFAEVRIHEGIPRHGPTNALAMTKGTDIHFASKSDVGDRFLLAHELTHVVQQRHGPNEFQLKNKVVPTGSLESEAVTIGKRVATGQPAGAIQGHSSSAPLYFEYDEHFDMGNLGSGEKLVVLSPGYSLPFGDVTALAGDHFESIEQMRLFARNPGPGPDSREEIEFAREWRGGNDVNESKYNPNTVKRQKERYLKLASNNPTHFPNPDAKDQSRTTASKAHDAIKKDPNDPNSGLIPKNAIAAYRLNHELAIAEAIKAGRDGETIDSALATEAFGTHFLTDAFSAGHLRTHRREATKYWNDKVPMFYYNFIEYLAENLARASDKVWSVDRKVEGAGPFGEGSREKVTKKLKDLPPMGFGEIVSLALHAYDNIHGVKAVSEGQDVTLMGDDHSRENGGSSMELAKRAVKLGVEDVSKAYNASRSRSGAQNLIGSDGLYAAERVIPQLKVGPDGRASTPGFDWMKNSVDELFDQEIFRKAIGQFGKDKARTVSKLLSGGDPDEANLMRKVLIDKLQNESEALVLIRRIIDYTPNTGGGWAMGSSTDDNAERYYNVAKAKGALKTLTVTQRIRLIRDIMDSIKTWDSEEEKILDLLLTASREDAIQVIVEVEWDKIADELEGTEDTIFREKFPRMYKVK